MGAGWRAGGPPGPALGHEPEACGTHGRGLAARKAHRGDGAGAGLEADVLVLLPVPAGHGALHAGTLGADRVQFNAGFCCGDGTVHRLCLHASAHHGHTALL